MAGLAPHFGAPGLDYPGRFACGVGTIGWEQSKSLPFLEYMSTPQIRWISPEVPVWDVGHAGRVNGIEKQPALFEAGFPTGERPRVYEQSPDSNLYALFNTASTNC